MTIDKAKLKALAESVVRLNEESGYPWEKTIEDGRLGRTSTAYALEANSAAVLELIAEIEQLESYLCACPDCGGQGEIFTGSYSYFGHMEPPEPNMTECVECDGKGLIGNIQDLHSLIVERDQLKADLSRVEPCFDDVQALVGALGWLGYSTPEGGEECAARWLELVRTLIRTAEQSKMLRMDTEKLAERDQLRTENADLKTGYGAYERVNAELRGGGGEAEGGNHRPQRRADQDGIARP